jgi:hypothetical protein
MSLDWIKVALNILLQGVVRQKKRCLDDAVNDAREMKAMEPIKRQIIREKRYLSYRIAEPRYEQML